MAERRGRIAPRTVMCSRARTCGCEGATVSAGAFARRRASCALRVRPLRVQPPRKWGGLCVRRCGPVYEREAAGAGRDDGRRLVSRGQRDARGCMFRCLRFHRRRRERLNKRETAAAPFGIGTPGSGATSADGIARARKQVRASSDHGAGRRTRDRAGCAAVAVAATAPFATRLDAEAGDNASVRGGPAMRTCTCTYLLQYARQTAVVLPRPTVAPPSRRTPVARLSASGARRAQIRARDACSPPRPRPSPGV